MSLLASPRQPPPPPPTSPSPSSAVPNGPQSPPQQQKEPFAQRINGFMSSKHRSLRSLKRGVSHTATAAA